MTTDGSNAVSRLLAFAIDWLVFALWAGVIFGIVLSATGGDPPRPAGPWIAQAVGFVTVTLPFTLYFAICESSRRQASIGKRVVGLCVLTQSGEPLSLRRALLRNAIKFVPWEFGHTLAQHAAFAESESFPPWLFGPAVIATVGPVWWLVALFVIGRTP